MKKTVFLLLISMSFAANIFCQNIHAYAPDGQPVDTAVNKVKIDGVKLSYYDSSDQDS